MTSVVDAEQTPIPEPRDVVDGIPDRAARRPIWKYVLLAAVFVAWLGMLALMQRLGRS